MRITFLLASFVTAHLWLILLVAVIGLLLLFLLYLFRHSKRSARRSAVPQETLRENAPLAIASPISGKLLPLSQVKDPTFSSGAMGQGCAILPVEGKVYAPCDGIISHIAQSRHAISLDSNEGVELLIHIGKDTASLNGEHFEPCCKAGDRVKTGDLLLSFDTDAIRKAGYDLTTPLLVLNAHSFEDLILTSAQKVSAGDRLFALTPKNGQASSAPCQSPDSAAEA